MENNLENQGSIINVGVAGKTKAFGRIPGSPTLTLNEGGIHQMPFHFLNNKIVSSIL